MTDATTQKPNRDPAVFGREIAELAKAEIMRVGLAVAEVGTKERQLASIKQRMVRSIDAAALAQVADGVSAADAKEWAKAAMAALGAEMARGAALA